MEGEIDTAGPLDPELRGGCFPYGFWPELRALWKLTWPLDYRRTIEPIYIKFVGGMRYVPREDPFNYRVDQGTKADPGIVFNLLAESLSMLFHYLIQPISIAFCGHLGKTQLAAVAMAISVIYVVVVSIGRGLAFGGDTFFAQTYGSNSKKNVGVYLQKGIIFCVFWTMPVIGVLLNTENILLLMRQDPVVSRLAQDYVQLFSPGVLAYCCLFLVMRYLLCQNRVIPIFVICFISCGVNALLNYGLIYQAKMGIKGSAIALFLTYYLVLILMLAYIWGTKLYRETWDGWSLKCLENWGEFSRVTSFSIFMTFLFWTCTEVGTFLGGVLSPRDLSAFSMSFQIEGFAWMIPLGIGGGCAARIGQYLGANKPKGAANTARVALLFAVLISVAFAVLCFVTRHVIPQAFTTNKDLINYTANILRLTSLFLLFEGFGGVGVFIIIGTGRQALGTIIMMVSYYLVAWPVGIPLMFATDQGLSGLWWGFDIGIIMEDICIVIFLLKLDWKKEAEKAVARAHVGMIDDEPNERTALLNNNPSSPINDSENVSPRPTSTTTQLVLKRLLVFCGFALTLVAGILARIFVPKYSGNSFNNTTSSSLR